MSEKLHLFHISNDIRNTISIFEPVIPNHRMPNEDSSIPRICVSTSVEGCIKGHPYALMYTNVAHENYLNELDIMEKEHYLLEHGLSGVLCKVYHFEVDKEIVKTDLELIEEGLVPDAKQSQEHWIMDTVSPTKVEYVLIKKTNVLFDLQTMDILSEEYDCHYFTEETIGKVIEKSAYFNHIDYLLEKFPKEEIWSHKFSQEEIVNLTNYINQTFEEVELELSEVLSEKDKALPF